MLTTVAKRIQTSLKRKGVVATSGDIKDYLRANVGNIENITKEEENNATKYFLSTATKLTVISDDVTTEDLTEVEETFSSVGGELGNIDGNIAEPTQMELETLTSEDVDIVNSVDNAINTASIQDIDSNDLHTNEAALDTENETALATATKSELVASTAGELGIVLNTGEIELIAQNVNYSSDDLQESLEEIKSAIIAFVRHKIALNSQKIGETLEEITQVATDGFNQNSQQLTDGLQNINKQLQQQRTDFKSKVKATLSVFQLPAAS
ncbi:hypothetical protein [Dolichospermum sp. LEGE 00246]|uniref:hypothetical protein n=1 Tax=Dolichospermum sp. LEGE 00246 TaxID=1828605 RepID=UPI001882F9F9|nr:hypothetical protein [Dolichospermum sp. LEGE 00246]MBE9257371.1 hypothetical protein [Dolichospermum sp. LEGE 00246]